MSTMMRNIYVSTSQGGPPTLVLAPGCKQRVYQPPQCARATNTQVANRVYNSAELNIRIIYSLFPNWNYLNSASGLKQAVYVETKTAPNEVRQQPNISRLKINVKLACWSLLSRDFVFKAQPPRDSRKGLLVSGQSVAISRDLSILNCVQFQVLTAPYFPRGCNSKKWNNLRSFPVKTVMLFQYAPVGNKSSCWKIH